ncbi:MAG: hypothetical protein AAB400_04315 [Patescibacteria group bacterium]
MIRKKIFYGILLSGGILLAANIAHAAPAIGNSGLLPVCADGKYGVNAFIIVIFNVIKLLWGLTGTVALVMFIVGGFTLLLASGDPQKVKGGVTTIRNAIIGIVIILGSWLIINTFAGIITQGTIPTSIVSIFGAEWSQATDPCY